MKSKDRQQVSAEAGRPELGRREPVVPYTLPPAYLDRIADLVGRYVSADLPSAKPLYLLIAPGVDGRALATAIFDRLQFSYQIFDCLAQGYPELDSDSAGGEAQGGHALIVHPECLSADELATLLLKVNSAANKRCVIATVWPLWLVGSRRAVAQCDVIGPAELRYNNQELQYLVDTYLPAMTAAVEADTPFSQNDLFAMTQGWPVVTECALAELARTALSSGLRFFPLAQLDGVKQHFVDSWLPALESRHRWLIEVSNLPLLSLDLLLSLYHDSGTAVQECLALGWLEPCRKNIGFYQVNSALDVLILSVYAQFKNDDVLQRAASWYQLNGYPTEAVQCLVSFVDSEQVLSLLRDDHLGPPDSVGGSAAPSRRAGILETFDTAASVAKNSFKLAVPQQITPMARAIIANVEKSRVDLKRTMDTGDNAATDAGPGAKNRSGEFTPSAKAAGHILSAFSYHQDKDPQAVSLAIAEAVEAGIDRKQLSAVIDFMDIHIRPLLRNEGGPLQLALRDLKHSAPAREVVAAQQQQLNHRELQVLQRVCEGYKNKEISEQLGLELSTIKWYTTGIYEKLQVRNRTQAVAKAQALKLFD